MTSWLVEKLLRIGSGRRDLAETITGDLVSAGRGNTWVLIAGCGIAFRYMLDRSIRFVGQVRTTARPNRRPMFMNTLWLDLRHALRGLRKSPGFASVAILTIALGVGANTAIFSLVHAIMLAPLPYPAQSEIVRIWPGESVTMGWTVAFQGMESFRHVAGVTGASASMTGRGEPMELTGGSVTAGHFEVLGVRPALGRPFHADDQLPSAEPVIILSHALWLRAFAGDSSVIGSRVKISEGGEAEPRVVGIMPAGHVGLRGEWEYWTPSVVDPETDTPFSAEGCFCWQLIGRLAPGVSIAEANAEVGLVARRIWEHSPADLREEALATAVVQPMLDDMVGDADASLTVLFGAVSLVLLIACLNVANLLLARGEGRRRDLAIRSALGGGRYRLMAQSLFESLTLGVVGGVLGVLLAASLVRYFHSAIGDVLPRTMGVAVNGPVMTFALGITILASLIFGLAPALGVLRTDPRSALAYRPGMSGRRHRRIRDILVAVEVALAVVLAIGAGLMVRTMQSLNAVEPGFRTENLLTLRLNQMNPNVSGPEAVDGFYRQVREAVAALPGVQSAATTNSLPLTGPGWGWSYSVDTEPLDEGAALPNARFRLISPGYFTSLEIPFITGRDITEADVDGAEEVVVVNQSFVDRHFDSPAEAMGHIVGLNTGHEFRVVGVVPDNLHRSLASPARAEMYRPRLFFPVRRRYLIVATVADAASLAPSVQRAIWDIDPNVPILDVRTMNEVRAYSTRSSSFYLEVLGAFAALAIVLGMIGVYGVLSFVVNQSRQGIGIRMALGADGGRVLRNTVFQGLKPVLLGLSLGIAGAALATEILESLLFGITPTDGTTFVMVAGLILTTAVIATLIPARRAAAVDPMRVLRTD
jgi:putative ABC transport system permease protein